MVPIERKSLVDKVYERLRRDIVTMRLPLGSKLNASELQEVYGVSTTPIREALNRLQQEGLVVYKNNTGASVLSLDAGDVMEIQYLAMTLHIAAIRLSMERCDHTELATQLIPHLKAYRRAERAQDAVEAIHNFVGVFYHNCGNQRLHKSGLAIQGQQLILRYLYANAVSDRTQSVQELEAMLACVLQHDADGVCDALRQNGDRAAQVLQQAVGTTE